MHKEHIVRKYENPNFISENREIQRTYYIYKNGCKMPNGIWAFEFYESDFEEGYIAEMGYKQSSIPAQFKTMNILTMPMFSVLILMPLHMCHTKILLLDIDESLK